MVKRQAVLLVVSIPQAVGAVATNVILATKMAAILEFQYRKR